MIYKLIRSIYRKVRILSLLNIIKLLRILYCLFGEKRELQTISRNKLLKQNSQ